MIDVLKARAAHLFCIYSFSVMEREGLYFLFDAEALMDSAPCVCVCVFVNLYVADLEMPLVANTVANG